MPERDSKERINSPNPGDIVSYHGDPTKYQRKNKRPPYDVYIVSGKYFDPISGRMSNYWYWKRVNEDGSLGKMESGYGDFGKPLREYTIEIVITPLNTNP